MKRKNNVGPSIEPRVTPDNICENSDNPCSLLIACRRVSRYDVNHLMVEVLNL